MQNSSRKPSAIMALGDYISVLDSKSGIRYRLKTDSGIVFPAPENPLDVVFSSIRAIFDEFVY